MILNEWLHSQAKYLSGEGITTARLDCLVLLADELKKDKSWLLAHPETVLMVQSLKKLNKHVERRAGHEPLAYIRGKSEFYGREFMVTRDTLEPRPETETMIDLLKQSTKLHKLTDQRVRPFEIVDVGTGSGCLAITARIELPDVEVVGVDISKKCLEIAKTNSRKLNADVKFHQGNLLETLPNSKYQIPKSQFAILANLPYVPDEHTINQAAMFEPKIAIFGGPDGLDLYRQMFSQINELEIKPCFIFTESLPFQHKELAQIAKNSGYKLKTSEDFIQVFVAD